MKVALGICLLALMSWQAVAQTPDNLCRTDFRYVDDHNYPDDWHLIVDSYDYENLFGGASGRWELRDVDGTGGQWDDNFGGSCQLEIGACTYTTPDQDNWFFTQYNSYGAAVEVFVTATFRWSRCTSNSACTNDFATVHRYDTDGRVATNLQTNINSYTPIVGGNAVASRLQQDALISSDITITLKFIRPNNSSGLYLGFQDTGTCGQIKRFQVYYKICDTTQLKLNRPLVSFNEIALPLENSTSPRMESATCAENAEPISSLVVRAYGNGSCFTNAQCLCKGGYKRVNNSMLECEACPVGTYRVFNSTNVDCTSCPLNSMAPMEGSSQCNCTNGYYRAPVESVSENCTKPPSKPTSFNVSTIESDSITLSWSAPNSNGGREVIVYHVEYEEVGSLDGFVRSNMQEITNDNYTIEGLKPVTTYIVRVIAENGVGFFEASPADVERRSAELVITTGEGLPGCPSQFRVVDNIIALWQPPDQPNGNISGYEINVLYDDPTDGSEVRIDPIFFTSSSFFYVLRKGVVPENVTATIQVRANTSAGYGEWCNEIEFVPFASPACEIPTQSSPDSCDIITKLAITAAVAVLVTALVMLVLFILIMYCCGCCTKSEARHKKPKKTDFDFNNPTYSGNGKSSN